MEDVSNGVEITKNEDHGWKTVSYHKKNRKQPKQQQQNGHSSAVEDSNGDRKNDVFRPIEQVAEGRNRKYAERKKAAAAATGDLPKRVDRGSDEEYSSDADGVSRAENGTGAPEEKKSKPKKPKKPKVSVAEASLKLDSSDLAAYLAEIAVSYEAQPDIQLMRFADYFGRAFSKVSGSQFPYMKMLKESPVAKMVDIPLSNISDGVYKTSTDWLNQRSTEALANFVDWALHKIFADQALHQGGTKSAKKVPQQASSKSQVAVFLVLAMVLRRRPDVLIDLLSEFTDNTNYQRQDNLPVLVWFVTQASQGDLATGLLMWSYLLFPFLSKSNLSQQSRDPIFEVVERIIKSPKARTTLVNRAVRKGARIVPPLSFVLLVRATFSSNSARGKANERLGAIYPILKEVALAVAPGSKAAKNICQQIYRFAIKAAGEGNSDLAKEATDIFTWCLTVSPDTYNDWKTIYMENLVASVVILNKLSVEWKVLPEDPSALEPLKSALRSFILKNENALTDEKYAPHKSTLKESQKLCKVLLGRASRGNGCLKAFLLMGAVAVGIGAVVTSNEDVKKMLVEFDVKKMLEEFNINLS